MYTQCPDCNTAFRVTAPVLQQAGGRVVCAGCGLAFNALERLTEDPPAAMAPPDDSKGVLETLVELTGPHQIRIEDTGVEWRVIDEDDPDEDFEMQATRAHDPDPDPGLDDTGSVRWYIEETPGEVAAAGDEPAIPEANDEVAFESRDGLVRAKQDARAEHGASDGPELLPEVSRRVEPQESLQLAHAADAADLQRYDDNTLLPDDFVEEREPSIPQRRAEDHIEPRSPEADEAQVDLALGEPDDWMDLLDEVGTARSGGEAKPEHEKSADTDDDTVERLSLESHAAAAHAEADDLAGADAGPAPQAKPEVDESFPSDIDTQFDLQAIEMGIDLTGNRELSIEEPVAEPATTAARDSSEAPGEPHAEAPAPHRQDERGIEASEPILAAAGFTEDAEISAEEAEERNRERAFEEELATAYAITLDDEPAAITTTTGKPITGKPAAPAKEPARPKHFVPAPTEEELTVNMLIDQDLIRLAEQQNVFTSGRKLEDLPLVETIIMEGETVRTALEVELLSGTKADTGDVKRSAGELTDATPAAPPDDTDLLMESWIKTKDKMRGGRRRADPPSYKMIVGVAVLGLLLAAQVVHAYRDSLATYSAFDKTVGSLYRLLGDPVIPDWNVKGWQFETTSGSTDETGQFLTISSRILNGTARSLPYPLLHVSLTDRWEEIIGSTLLGPSEYLANGADAGSPVAAGGSFAAVVRIDAPSPDATGFKLNVCYREPDRRLRCATEDFKD
ncbi:MAG TPA: zinc-ribbon and DUF3426 domain-containing protein [Woeseiaceae bacterium]|nr:zinc-ribbon and DUF3426 domain-containing protein [Woeseiaceae bacterium]